MIEVVEGEVLFYEFPNITSKPVFLFGESEIHYVNPYVTSISSVRIALLTHCILPCNRDYYLFIWFLIHTTILRN